MATVKYESAKYKYLGDSSVVTNIDWLEGNTLELNLDNDPTLTFSNAPVGKKMTLLLKQQIDGQRVILWDPRIIWVNDTTPTLQTITTPIPNPKYDVVEFEWTGKDYVGSY